MYFHKLICIGYLLCGQQPFKVVKEIHAVTSVLKELNDNNNNLLLLILSTY